MSTDQLIDRWCKDHATPATVQWLVDNFEPAQGSSIRRSILYNFYLEHCLGLKVEPLNPASFGKLIHSVFLGLKTRRLGTRGNSKYHYYGIQVKSSSPLSKQMPSETDFFLLSNTNNEFDHPSNQFNMSPNDYVFSPLSTNQNSSTDFFFPYETTSVSNELPTEISTDDIKIFQKIHDDYSTKLFQSFLKFQYDLIEKSMQQFWSLTNVHCSQANEFFNNDPIITWKFQRMSTLSCIVDHLRTFYVKFYQSLIDQYFPDVLSSFTPTMTEAIRTIATNISYWLIHAIEHLYDPLKSFLIQSTESFSSILLRYTSLNHLSFTVQSMLFQSSRLQSIGNDLSPINSSELHEQMNLFIDDDPQFFLRIDQCLKNLFQCPTLFTFHQWIAYLDAFLDESLLTIEQSKDYSFYVRQFVLKTNFYCSLILRELTLQHATSLGSFHLFQLFLEAYLSYRLEQKISFDLNQSILQTVIDHHEQRQQQQKFLLNKTYQDLFNDDDLDDDFESLSDDLNDQRPLLKPLSPVQIDEFLLASDGVSTSFSYIFEDLQPLSNEIF